MNTLPDHLPPKPPTPSARGRKKKNHHLHIQTQGSWGSMDHSSSFSVNTDLDGNPLSTDTRPLTYDFVWRSLRRRLWKAFREDDVSTAMRAYQATLPDFVQWLEEERGDKQSRARALSEDSAGTASTQENTKPGRSGERKSIHPRRPSFDQATSKQANHKSPRRSRRHSNRKLAVIENDENQNDYRYELLKHQQQQRIETEAMIGGPSISILQSRMNPSDPFIADDYLSPYEDSTFEHPARKTLPDPVQHAAEQKALEAERKRRRKANRPRMAFKRMILGRRAAQSDRAAVAIENSFSIQDHDDFDLVDSMIVDAMISPIGSTEFSDNVGNSHEEEDLLMTTPLHEAARLGAGDFVRLMLANGGDTNTKNGESRTAIHMCAGGYTTEEQRLLKAADEEGINEEGDLLPSHNNKKKKHRKDSNEKPSSSSSLDSSLSVTSPIGIQPPIIPNESLELMRQLDAENSQTTLDGGKDIKFGKKTYSPRKSPSKVPNKRRLFGKILSFSNRKDRNDHNDTGSDGLLDSQLNQSFKSQSNHNYEKMKANPKRLYELMASRMEAMHALLSWVHMDSGEGPSINAVDNKGRTSLHYAAELGRSDICAAIMSNFGVMLTIVDEIGTRTPCEVAAHQGHTALAAQLEARALLYIDPYGLDDEMMDTIMAANEGGSGNTYQRKNPIGRLVPPYRWFVTLSKEEIANERVELLEEAREKLMDALFELPSPIQDEIDTKPRALPGKLKNVTREANLDPYVAPSVNKRQQLGLQPASCDEGKISDNCGNKKLQYIRDCHIERYMTHHDWDLQNALKAIRQNREEAFVAAGIQNCFDDKNGEKVSAPDTDARVCSICFESEVEKENWIVLRNCGHAFCRACLTNYAKECASKRTPLHLIKCPEHKCNAGFSELDLQSLLKNDHTESLGRIMEASIDNFVTSHNNFKFCTHPGCSGVVHRLRQPKWSSAGYDESILNYTGAVCTVITPDMEKIGSNCTLTYEGVEDLDYANCRSLQQPKKAHRFCFSCGEGVHWPLTCEGLEVWNKRVSDEIGNVDDENGESDFNELAQKIWLKANTRPCPKCKVPIEKNDGCNHMVCYSCHHEFCWICRQDWRLHSTDTGGFFRCNIWKEDDPDRMADRRDGGESDNEMLGTVTNSDHNFFSDTLNDQGYGTSIHTAREAWRKKQDIKRFLHHYSRWEAHKESHILEQKMGDTVCTRLAPVVQAAIDFDGSQAFNFGDKGLSFLHNAFFELAECRSTLRHSYAFSFHRYQSKASVKPSPVSPTSYLISKRKEKLRFERLQSELETLTEQMSDIVARSHLRATQMQITYLTAGAADKRLEFNNFLFQIYREEKRETERQNAKKSEKIVEEDKRIQSAASTNNNRTRSRENEVSSAAEIFNELLQIRDQRYSPTTTPYVSTDNLPLNGRNLTMQLLAEDERLLAIGERLRGMEGLLRSHDRTVNRLNHNTDEDVEIAYYEEDEDDHHDPSNRMPAAEMWACSLCTFMNTGGFFCAMCEHPRQQ